LRCFGTAKAGRSKTLPHNPDKETSPKSQRRGFLLQQIGNRCAIGLGFYLGTKGGGKLAGKFRVVPGVTQGGMTDDVSPFFFRHFESRLSLSQFVL
jgi:hypothetical protein